MRYGCRILSFLLALVLLLGTLAGCASTYKPLNYLKKAVENTVEKRFGGRILSTVLEALSGGSVSVAFGGTDLVKAPLEAAELTLWMDSSEQFLTLIGSAAVGGKKYDGKLFLNRERAVVSSAAFFGSTDLGVDFDTLEKDLKNSIFRNNSGTEYAVTWMGESAAKDLTTIKDGFFTIFASLEEWVALSDELTEDFLELLVEHAPYKRYSKDGRIHVAVTVDNDSLARTLRDTRAAMVKDKEICRELRRVAKTRDEMVSAASGSRVTLWQDEVEDFIASSAGVDVLCNLIDAMADFTLQLDASIRRSTDVIETLSMSFELAGAEIFSFGLDLTDKRTNVITLSYGGLERKLSYTVTKDSLRYYNAEMLYVTTAPNGDTPVYVTGDLKADRSKDSFELTLRNGEETRYFAGSFDEKIDGFEVAVERVSVNGEQRTFLLSLAVDVDSKPPEAPEKYEPVVTASVPRFAPIATTFTNACVELKASWGEAEISPRALSDLLLDVIGVDEEIA